VNLPSICNTEVVNFYGCFHPKPQTWIGAPLSSYVREGLGDLIGIEALLPFVFRGKV